MKQKRDLVIYVAIGLVAFCGYANTLGHGFVYDDNRQILMNPLIQRSEFYGKALTSDVWAFKGSDKIAASNYFRPTFVGWLIVNWKLFGPNAFGWHLTSILLHVGVCLLLLVLLRRLGCDEVASILITVLFAVHPVHVENIAWISGATDTLLAFFLLISLLLAQSYAAGRVSSSKARSAALLVLSVAAYLLALGAKEVALLCAPLYWIVLRSGEITAGPKRRQGAGNLTLVYLIAAAAFFVLRFRVLGSVFIPVEDPIARNSALLSVPKIFVFYLRQILFPISLSPALPIRPVDGFSFSGVVVPLMIACAVLAGLWLLAKRSEIQRFGFALFILTLVPVINPTNFGIEHMVHDRYLYLPLAGILIAVIPAIVRFVRENVSEKNRIVPVVVFAAVVLALGIKTISYNSAWRTSETLWRYAVTVDPGSSHAWYNLAAATPDAQESFNAFERSLQIKPTGVGLTGKARALIALGDYEGAVATAREAISIDPNFISAFALFQAYEAESLALFNLGKYHEAEMSLRSARPRLPIYYGVLTEKLAVLLYVQDRKSEALAELESARGQARTEMIPGSKQLFLRLGMLYFELGRKDEAREALEEYLAATDNAADPATIADRRQASELLRKVRGG
jgi:hypothetical protein